MTFDDLAEWEETTTICKLLHEYKYFQDVPRVWNVV